ncbi:hypothetical protein BC829DRAFT_449239 [Chytridium lagenaria]|nr:hypothetical protein BC829DRAFT_449239 [Chytridium lagenaria]
MFSSPSGGHHSIDIGYLRLQSRHRLKSAWESLFERYSKDFGDEADEINIVTGQVEVDKGFLNKRTPKNIQIGTLAADTADATTPKDKPTPEMGDENGRMLCFSSPGPKGSGRLDTEIWSSPSIPSYPHTLQRSKKLKPLSSLSSSSPSTSRTPLTPTNPPIPQMSESTLKLLKSTLARRSSSSSSSLGFSSPSKRSTDDDDSNPLDDWTYRDELSGPIVESPTMSSRQKKRVGRPRQMTPTASAQRRQSMLAMAAIEEEGEEDDVVALDGGEDEILVAESGAGKEDLGLRTSVFVNLVARELRSTKAENGSSESSDEEESEHDEKRNAINIVASSSRPRETQIPPTLPSPTHIQAPEDTSGVDTDTTLINPVLVSTEPAASHLLIPVHDDRTTADGGTDTSVPEPVAGVGGKMVDRHLDGEDDAVLGSVILPQEELCFAKDSQPPISTTSLIQEPRPQPLIPPSQPFTASLPHGTLIPPSTASLPRGPLLPPSQPSLPAPHPTLLPSQPSLLAPHPTPTPPHDTLTSLGGCVGDGGEEGLLAPDFCVVLATPFRKWGGGEVGGEVEGVEVGVDEMRGCWDEKVSEARRGVEKVGSGVDEATEKQGGEVEKTMENHGRDVEMLGRDVEKTPEKRILKVSETHPGMPRWPLSERKGRMGVGGQMEERFSGHRFMGELGRGRGDAVVEVFGTIPLWSLGFTS